MVLFLTHPTIINLKFEFKIYNIFNSLTKNLILYLYKERHFLYLYIYIGVF